MEKKRKIAQYRERLDETLASPVLTNKETIKTLVGNQLLNSSFDETGGLSENVVERKTTDVYNFLDMLRSASVKDNEVLKTSEASHGQWKLKQDTEEVRIMYCEGPQGTPFHSLLVEGYIDAPLDVCLCVSWESTLYRKWWPQYSFPPFKIITCNCLQKVRIGEQISLVREAVVHYFVFEYFQEGLMIALLTSIDDLKSIDRTTHGFTNEGIPEAKDMVRIEMMGGFALQKVTEDRSFFRTIVNMDIKLNFIPPSLINFISRQLIGDGFKLYQKAVTSVSSYEDYRKALEKPLYSRIREALYSSKESKEAMNANELKNGAYVLPEEHFIEGMQDDLNEIEQKVHNINDDSEYFHIDVQVTDRNVVGEIEEEESKENMHLDEADNGACIPPKEYFIEGMQDGLNEIERKVHNINDDSEYFHIDVQVTDGNVVAEIEEEVSKENTHLDEDDKGIDQFLTKEILENHDSEFSQNDAHVTDGNVVCEIEEEESKENTYLDEDDKGIDQFLMKEISENQDSESSQNNAQGTDRNILCKIEEVESEESTESDEDMDQSVTDEIPEISLEDGQQTISISPGVEQALMTLEKAIYMVHEYGFNSQSKSLFDNTNKQITNVEMSATNDSTISEDGVHPDVEESKREIMEKSLQESWESTGIQDCMHAGSNSYLREGNHSRIVPASPEQDLSNPDEINQVALSSSQNRTIEVPIFNQTMHDNKQMNVEGNGFPEYTINGGKKFGRNKKRRFCCFPWNSA